MLADDADNQETVYGDLEEYGQKRDLMHEAIATLNERETRIIQARKLAEEPLTLEELSEEFGVSRERIRQIEARALEKLTAYVDKTASPALLEHQAA